MLKDISSFPKITIILRGYSYESIRAVAQVLVGTKINSMEITMNQEENVAIIEKVVSEFKDDLIVGAGTVLNLETAKKVIDAGAKFILSPIVFEKEIYDYCKDKGVLTVPGAMTPSEVYSCFKNGADIVKIFPITSLADTYAKDIQAPLGNLTLMGVGGVNIKNANMYLKNGVSYLGIGSGVFNKEDIINCNINNLKESLNQFIDSIESW